MTITYTHYSVTRVPSGETWTEAFTPSNVHTLDDGAHAAVTAGEGLTYEQATRQIAIWHRAQGEAQEFICSLTVTTP